MSTKRSRRHTSFGIILLLFTGTIGAVLAFWLIEHPQTLARSGTFIAILLGVFFVTYTCALLWYLRRRNREQVTPPVAVTPPADLQGTIYGLVPGDEYQVMKSFKDFYGNSFEQGELLRFKQRHFVPYHGGHTIIFDERALYLQEDLNKEILDHFSEYIAQVKR